jgi:RNA polymerase sigma-70 factor (ECF subfamily)
MDAGQVAETPTTTQLDLLTAARGGSQEAARRLMREFGPSMLRTARNVLGRYGGSEADDVVQEAFIAALRTETLPSGELGAWLRTISARKALDSMRAARRRGERPLPEPGSGASELEARGGAGAPHDVLAVREALSRLSAADRAVLTLADLEGWSMAETAAALGLTNVAVRLRAVRARRKLARLLRPLRGRAGEPQGGEGGAR